MLTGAPWLLWGEQPVGGRGWSREPGQRLLHWSGWAMVEQWKWGEVCEFYPDNEEGGADRMDGGWMRV